MLKIILAIIIFSLIIIIHELGHFLLAKKNGICVEEFSIGIGPTIFGIQRGETKYSVKCLPFGGCCVMLGEDGDSNDPRAFGSKSALTRFSVIFAGPFFNFLLAFVLALFVVGVGGADPAVVGKVDRRARRMKRGLRKETVSFVWMVREFIISEKSACIISSIQTRRKWMSHMKETGRKKR